VRRFDLDGYSTAREAVESLSGIVDLRGGQLKVLDEQMYD
jgi:hypothetical protein